MLFFQRRFFPFGNGAPSIHSLQANPANTKVLVTTDRTVQLLRHDSTTGYTLNAVNFLEYPNALVDVIATGVIDAPDRERVVVVYAERQRHEDQPREEPREELTDTMFLIVIDPANQPTNQSTKETSRPRKTPVPSNRPAHESLRFELVAAPTAIMTVRARSSGGGGGHSVFHGVIVFRMESMVAFGFVDDQSRGRSTQCERLSNEQFAVFFPEFAQFRHPVLSVHVHTTSGAERGWIAFGCADGFIRVFAGDISDGVLSGPYETRDMLMNGPVMSLSLFTSMSDGRRKVNIVTGCAIGEAIVYEDIFGQSTRESIKHESLVRSDEYDSIFSVVAADVDLDGDVELLIGTDNQVLLAYKKGESQDESTGGGGASGGAHRDVPNSTRRWGLLCQDDWELRVFGSLYSLAWLDLNHDGVKELIVVSATGVYVFEADPQLVLQRLSAMLKVSRVTPTPDT